MEKKCLINLTSYEPAFLLSFLVFVCWNLEMKGCTKFLICLCSLGVVSSFSVNTPDFSKSQSKNGASSQRFRPNLKRQQTKMTLSPQLLKSGIATYGIIIGAGGLVAGNWKIYYLIRMSMDPAYGQMLLNCRYQNWKQAVDNLLCVGEHCTCCCIHGLYSFNILILLN